MTDLVNGIIRELTSRRPRPAPETTVFSRWAHNRDLCPRFKTVAQFILDAFRRFHGDVYDIQGLRDAGTDILVRRRLDDELSYICIQVKSEQDLCEKDYLQTLKAQHFDTSQQYRPLLHYYIALCCDVTNEANVNRVRSVASTFAREAHVTVVAPEHAMAFLRSKKLFIDSLMKVELSEHDTVLMAARDSILDLAQPQRAVLLYTLRDARPIELRSLESSPFVRDVFSANPAVDLSEFDSEERDLVREAVLEGTWPSEDDDDDYLQRLAHNLESLEPNFLTRDDQGLLRARPDDHYAIRAVMLDAIVRYGYEGDALLEYMLEVLAAVAPPPLASA